MPNRRIASCPRRAAQGPPSPTCATSRRPVARKSCAECSSGLAPGGQGASAPGGARSIAVFTTSRGMEHSTAAAPAAAPMIMSPMPSGDPASASPRRSRQLLLLLLLVVPLLLPLGSALTAALPLLLLLSPAWGCCCWRAACTHTRAARPRAQLGLLPYGNACLTVSRSPRACAASRTSAPQAASRRATPLRRPGPARCPRPPAAPPPPRAGRTCRCR